MPLLPAFCRNYLCKCHKATFIWHIGAKQYIFPSTFMHEMNKENGKKKIHK